MSFNDGFNIRAIPWPSNTPVSGNSIIYNGSQWIAADISGSGGNGSGDITAVNAGTNLTGGGISGDVTVSLSSSVVGLTNLQTTTLTASHVTGTDLKIDYIDFNNDLAIPTFQTGRLHYDPATSDLIYDTNVSGVTINIGQQTVVRAKNTSGAQINKGKFVRIYGGSGSFPVIQLADWAAETGSANTIGAVMQNVAQNGFTYVLLNGILDGVNTNNSIYNDGDLLFLSSSGDFTKNQPLPPKHAVRLGQVVRAQTNNGSIFVKVDNGYELGELHDIYTGSVANGDLLIYNTSLTAWNNSKTLSGSYTVSGSITASNFVGDLNGTASLSSDLTNKLKLVSTLTYDASATQTATTFNNWQSLWDTYLQTSGAIDIFLNDGVVVSTNYPVYQFRKNTKLISTKEPHGASRTITIPSGTYFSDLFELDSVKLENSSSSPVLTYTENNPHLTLSNGSSLISSKNAPVILWDKNPSTSQLNITFGYNAKLLSGSHPVIEISGSAYTASVGMFLGQGSIIENNTLAGNVDSNINVVVKDGSNEFSFVQPLLSGTINNNTFSTNTTFDLNHPNTILSTNQLHTQQLNVFSPSLGYAPVGIFQAFSTATTSSNPEAFSLLSIPPVISAMLEVYIIARDTSSSDTAGWKFKSMIIGDGTGAYSGSLGLLQDFHDYTAGASTWNISASYNTPNSGDIRFYAIGENSKTINWALYQTVTIVLGV